MSAPQGNPSTTSSAPQQPPLPQPPITQICSPPYCGGCHMKFKLGEKLAIVDTAGDMGGPLVCGQFGFGPFQFCGGDCTHPGYTPALHWKCSQSFIGSVPSEYRSDFVESVCWTWPPPEAYQTARREWYRTMIVAHFHERLGIPPAPLADAVTDDDLRTVALRNTTHRWLHDQQVNTVVDIKKPMWRYFTNFEGLNYLMNVSNKAPEKGDSARPLTNPSECHVGLAVSYDHVGIRDVAFYTKNDFALVKKKAGLYWKTLRLLPDLTKLYCWTDGVKLREVTATDIGQLSLTHRQVFWQLPEPPTDQYYLIHMNPTFTKLRMHCMEVNKDVIKGYSVCWYRGMITMRSHLEGENVDFYEQMQKTKTGAVWLHLPVVRDEKLFQIWIMDTKGLFGLVMAIVTTRGIVKIMGPVVESLNPHNTEPWVLVKQFGDAAERLYYQNAHHGIRALGFKGPFPDSPVQPLMLPQHQVPVENLMCHEVMSGGHTSCSLSGVTKVTPSGYRLNGHLLIMGLLLEYDDGHMEACGEVRFDGMGDALSVKPGDDLWLGFDYVDLGCELFGVDVKPAQPMIRAQFEWACLPFDGTLDWLFTNYHRRIYHDGNLCEPGYDGYDMQQ